MPNRVVVTGMGVVTPIGIGVEAFWQALLEKCNGVKVRTELNSTTWPIRLFSSIDNFDGKQWIRPRKAMKVMCLPIQYGCAAAAMALEQAALSSGDMNPDRLGTVFGSEPFFADPLEVAGVFQQCIQQGKYVHDCWGTIAMREIEPLWMLKYLPNMLASHISISADARGPSNSICQADASSMLAAIEGVNLIQRGACDAVIVGGTGSLASLSAALYRRQQEISRRTSQPDRACRPFDADRDGTVFGEGAGAFVLENHSHAQARGAEVLAMVTGYSHGYGDPQSDDFETNLTHGLQSVRKQCLTQDSVISHINAQGSGDVRTDALESRAIRSVFGDTPVVAIKGHFGNLGPGCSAIEVIASVMSLRQATLPPTRNFETQDVHCPININTAVTQHSGDAFIKTSFSTTGQFACMAFQRSL